LEAEAKNYTVVDNPTIIITHLTEVIKDNLHDLLSYAETQNLLNALDKSQQKMINDLIPSQVSMAGVQKILQILLSERVSIKDLPTILEGINEGCISSKNPMHIAEQVRSRLSRQITFAYLNPEGVLPIVVLSPQWEQAFVEALVGENETKQLAMSPSKLQDFVQRVKQIFDKSFSNDVPVLLTAPYLRPYVRSVIERFRPMTVVMSQNEIHPKAKIKTIGQV
jgi:flagellar biosynthesis protein FlhA